MDKLKVDVAARMTSRKFLVAVVAALVAAAAGQWTEFAAVVLGYLGVEGIVDVRSVGHQVNVVLDEASTEERELAQEK